MLSLPLVQRPEDREVPLYTGNVAEDLQRVSRDRLAERITGGLSQTSKMPCPSWGISAARCRIGSALAQQEGTTCHQCYATRGRYRFGNVQDRLEGRYEGLFHQLWTPSMVFLIHYFCNRYFRWMDSGDVQGEHHFHNIVTVAAHTPEVRHWLPTREIETVRAVLRRVALPWNLLVRVSAHQVDGRPPRGFPHTSTVVTEGATCPAPKQRGACGECRACWEPSVPNVAYRLH